MEQFALSIFNACLDINFRTQLKAIHKQTNLICRFTLSLLFVYRTV